MGDKQFQVSVRAQASLFQEHLAHGQLRKAEAKMKAMTYFWHGATFAAKALGQSLHARFPEVCRAWEELHSAWSALERVGDESGELRKPSEGQLTSLQTLAGALHDRAVEAEG